MKKLFTFLCCMLAVIGMQAQSYVKVTSAPADWSGDYLIVCESQNVAFDGSMTSLDVKEKALSVNINNNEIASTSTTNAATFTIIKNGSNYNVKSKSGYYIGQTANSNGLKSSTSEAYNNTITIDADGSVNIISSGGAYLRFNASSGENRFRYFKSGTYKNQKAIALYKYTEASTPDEPDEPEEPALPTLTADATTLTFDRYTDEEPTGKTVEVSVQNIDPEVISGVISGNNPDKFEVTNDGLVYTVSCTATEVGEYTATLTFSAEGVDVEPVKVDLSATIEERPDAVRYQLVTDASTLREDNQVIIVAANANYALSTNQKSSNRGAVEITKEGNYIDIANDKVQKLTLRAGTKEGTFAFYTGSGYLYAASNSSNHLKTETTLSDNSSWTISIASGAATIEAQGNYTRNVMRYNPNNGDPLFACYASASQQAVALYRIPYAEDIVCEQSYFLVLNEEWKAKAGNYYAKFINLNTNEHYALVEGVVRDEAVEFYLSQYNIVRSGEMPVYTHVIYYNSESGDLADASVKTEEVAMGGKNIYTIDGGPIGTGIESVVVAEGIRYAYGVVEAEGAIEVYNVNGTVVARGNDNVDLAGLNRGVYIVRNGNQVRKVVR